MAVFELCGIVCFHVKTYKLRFNATTLLERLRNKRLVYVGDSLNRNQWVSMVCLVESAVPPELKSMHTNGSLTTFKVIVSFFFSYVFFLSYVPNLFGHGK